MPVKNEGVRSKPLVRLSPELRSQINTLALREGVSNNSMLEAIVETGLTVYIAKQQLVTSIN